MIRVLPLLIAFATWPEIAISQQDGPPERPNIVLIMTDDQGIGDLGVMGNPVIETPNLDQLASESTWLTQFYVHPVCAPTRACLMTGRYNYRTRAIDTYVGRAMMEPDEITLAEVLDSAGYATGIFGKWHLGDCYPMRAMDQGFETAVVHRGGGIGQPSDPPAARRQYTDPILFRNGDAEAFQGYCTDIYYDEAFRHIEEASREGRPFFVYLPDNTPHGPFHDVPEELYQHYLDKDISRASFGGTKRGHDFGKIDADFIARVYAMITNVDRNVGRLMKKLQQLQLDDNTIVIFMCDNGPNSRRYVRGFRGKKGSVYEGGIRSPFFIRWPKMLEPNRKIHTVAAHIDVMPTLLGLARIPKPDTVELDGLDLSELLATGHSELPGRNIYIQSHRGNQPVRYHHMAVRNQRWKLLNASGFGKQKMEGAPQFELYNMIDDPFEMNDIANENPEVVKSLRQDYDRWFDDVSATRPDNYQPPRIVLDPRHEEPVVLTRQDWRRINQRGWGSNGKWLIRVDRPLTVNLKCRLLEQKPAESIRLKFSENSKVHEVATGQDGLIGTFQNLELQPGKYSIETAVTYGDSVEGVYQIEITYPGP